MSCLSSVLYFSLPAVQKEVVENEFLEEYGPLLALALTLRMGISDALRAGLRERKAKKQQQRQQQKQK